MKQFNNNFRLNNNSTRILILVVSLFALIKLFFMFTTYDHIGWDESVYVGMGKYIASGGTSGLWEEIRPPLLPLIYAPFSLLSYTTLHKVIAIIALLFTLAVVILLYVLANTLFPSSKYIGLLSALLLLITNPFVENSFHTLSSIPSTAFMLAALVFYYQKKPLWIVGIFAGLTALMRFPSGLIIIVLAGIICAQSRGDLTNMFRNVLSFGVGVALVVLPFFIANYFLYASLTQNIFTALLYPLIRGSFHAANPYHAITNSFANYSYYVILLFKQNPLLVFSVVPLLIGFKSAFSKRHPFMDSKHLIHLYTFLVVYLLYYSLIVNKQPRFSVIFLPFVMILSAYAINYLLEKNISQTQKRAPFHFALIFLLIIVSIFTCTYTAKALTPTTQHEYVDTYFLFFDQNALEFTQPILTTEPTFAAFSSKKFIPMYNNIDDMIQIYHENKDNASALVYYDQFFPCQGNQECSTKKQNFFEALNETHDLIEISHQFDTKYVFKIN